MQRSVKETIDGMSSWGRWEDVYQYPNYQVSTSGRVISFARGEGRLLKPCLDGKGYPRVVLYNDQGRKTVFIHRLVAGAFITNPDNLRDVNHKDSVRTNNNVTNLEWVSQADNVKHAFEAGRMAHGEHVPTSKLKAHQAVAIHRAYHDYGLTQRLAAAIADVDATTVANICKGRTWKKEIASALAATGWKNR